MLHHGTYWSPLILKYISNASCRAAISITSSETFRSRHLEAQRYFYCKLTTPLSERLVLRAANVLPQALRHRGDEDEETMHEAEEAEHIFKHSEDDAIGVCVSFLLCQARRLAGEAW